MGTVPPPRPKKRFGQNFLVQPKVAEKLVASLPLQPEDSVVELGPGTGALTILLAKRCARVVAIELERDVVAFLSRELEPFSNVEIIHGDMLQVDLSAIKEKFGERLKIIGNLPYNVSTQLLIRLIEMRSEISWAGLMFQKEVAHRIIAQPGTKDYGVLSVLTQYAARVSHLFDVSPGSFRPKPKVWSAFLLIEFGSPSISALDFQLFRHVVHAAFQQRRKKIVNSLRVLRQFSVEQIQYALSKACIDTRYRAEEVPVESFVILSNILAKINQNR